VRLLEQDSHRQFFEYREQAGEAIGQTYRPDIESD
jgi:hypothetical protein